MAQTEKTVSPSGGLGRSADSAPPAVPFDQLLATHRGALRQFKLGTWLLVGVGVLIVILGLAGVLPQLPSLVVGIVTAAVAVFPYREMVERDERMEGLRVLQDEWQQMSRSSATPAQDSDRFFELLWKLYGAR